MNKFKVSVIMGIYNCEETLESSLNSLISQTFQDFNIILCDDGSIDNTYSIAREYCKRYPGKLTLLKNNKNMGLNYTLNHCLQYANGDYVARMDGDDISLPNRFEKEVEFLDNNMEYAIVSSPMIYFDETGDWGVGSSRKSPRKSHVIIGTPFAHAACMVRKEAYEAVGGYSIKDMLLRVEDYHLWVKMYAKGYKGYNLQEPLYKMRDDRDAVSRRNFKGRINEAYVKWIAIKELKLPFYYIRYLIRPIIVGLLPQRIYIHLHKKRLKIRG